jgi:transposase InsO family protein
VRQFLELYNAKWLFQKLGYQSPLEARRSYYKLKGAA